MSTIETTQAQGARTGEQFLEGLARGGREIWLRGEKISHPLLTVKSPETSISLPAT